MSSEAEAIIKKVRTVVNVVGTEPHNKGELIQQATHVLTHNELKDIKAEIADHEYFFSDANRAFTKNITDAARSDRARRLTYLKKKLVKESAPDDLRPDTKDALHKEVKRLDAIIQDGMPPHEVMRRNPAGAVDWHRQWEKRKKNAILARKNALRMLNPQDDSKDLCNVEMIRPSMTAKGAPATFMAESQIPGYVSYGHIADDLWEESGLNLYAANSPYARKEAEEVEQKPDTAMEDKLSVENQALKEKIALLEADAGEKEKMKKEARQKAREAASQRMKAMHAARRAARAGLPAAPQTSNDLSAPKNT